MRSQRSWLSLALVATLATVMLGLSIARRSTSRSAGPIAVEPAAQGAGTSTLAEPLDRSFAAAAVAEPPRRAEVPAPRGEAVKPAPAELDVRVVSSVHGGVIAGVELLLYEIGDFEPGDPDRRSRRTTSGSDGRARFTPETDARWGLDVTPTDSHGHAQLELNPLAPGERRSLDLMLDTPDDVPWYGLVTLGGEPLQGARVRLIEIDDQDVARAVAELESDMSGLVHVAGTSWKAHDVRADAPGLGLTVVELFPGHETPARAQELPLWPVGSLLCRVVDPAGAPVPGVEVRAFARAFELRPPDALYSHTSRIEVAVFTDDAGGALLADVPAELWIGFELRRSGELVLEEPEGLVLAAGQEAERRFVLGGAGRIAGSVLTVEGAPLAGVAVDLGSDPFTELAATVHTAEAAERSERSVETNAAGRFVFEGVPYGAWYVGTRGNGDDPALYVRAPRVELGADRPEAEITLRLERGLFIRGRLVDEEGVGVPGVPVHGWNDVVGGAGRTESDAEGHFELGPVPAGRYNVWATGAEGYVEPEVVQVVAGEAEVALVIVLCRGLALRGVVVDAATGTSVPHASVSIFAPTSDRPYAFHAFFHATDGRFAVSTLPRGEISVRATTEEGGIGIMRGVILEPGVEADEVRLPLYEGIPVRTRYVGEPADDLTLLATVNGIPISYVAIDPGETTTFFAPPGRLHLRVESEGMDPIERDLDVSPGDRLDVVLTAED